MGFSSRELTEKLADSQPKPPQPKPPPPPPPQLPPCQCTATPPRDGRAASDAGGMVLAELRRQLRATLTDSR